VVTTLFVRKTLVCTLLSTTIAMSFGATASAQSADDNRVAEYAALLQQIENMKLNIAHKNTHIAHQQEEIALLRKEIAGAEALNSTIEPMLKKMAEEAEAVISTDLPFKAAERFARLDSFKDSLNGSEVAPVEKLRKGLNVFAAEVGYGQTLEAYPGDNPVNNAGARFTACQEDVNSTACGITEDITKKMGDGATLTNLKADLQDGTFLRYGRMALSYMQHDGSEGYRYDPTSKEWTPVGGPKMGELRRAIRIARGEAAPGVVTAPVQMMN